MADTLKCLGQSAPSATTETDLYTVPSSTSAVVSTLTVCNRANSSTTFRVSHAVGGGATANKDYLVYDATIYANETITFTLGVAMATTDKLKVYAGTANLSFNAHGVEVT